MDRKYYSSRRGLGSLTLQQLYLRLQRVFLLFQQRDFFKGKAEITATDDIPAIIRHESAVAFSFELFPISGWSETEITEDHIFDAIEFLHDYVSKPGRRVSKTTETNWNYDDYESYDDEAGRAEFRQKCNLFLADYRPGYELVVDGTIQRCGTHGLQYLLDADIIPLDEVNVDSKVRRAISRWKSRHATEADRKECIRDLADVFEWLKQTKGLGAVLDGKDESALFEIANNFAIRHHNPKQKGNYDRAIWYSWMFHFYLATYHASVRLLVKKAPYNTRSVDPG